MQRILEDVEHGAEELLRHEEDDLALSEDELDHAKQPSYPNSDQESDDGLDMDGCTPEGARGSLGSSLTRNTLEEAGTAEPIADGVAQAVRYMRAPPMPQQAIRMGTSVPISINRSVTSKWERSEEPHDGYGPHGTFIPPHQLSQMDNEFMFSFTGASPSTAMKREKLKVRNAILARTGFLETPSAPALGAQPALEHPKVNRLASGGLSQALSNNNLAAIASHQ